MTAIVQRVTEASVTAGAEHIGTIGIGLVVLVAVVSSDSDSDVDWSARKLRSLRLFRSGEKNFDLDVAQVGGSILLVSNFTIAADTCRGRRPSFDAAADPEVARVLFDRLVFALRESGVPLVTGRFGADMRVSITNDGPVTVIVDSASRG